MSDDAPETPVPDHDRVSVAAGSAAYDVVVRAGALMEVPALAAEAAPAARYVVIADDRVADLYGSALTRRFRDAGLTADLLSFPAGEASKTRETWARLTDRMLEWGVGRDGCVVALGGGVTGDLAGFVAATYMRGIPVVQVPTSLLAMVDASVGGKTAVDTPSGKNLVGAFHQPSVVVVDPDVLATLELPDLRAGCAEALKHGAIADAAHFAELVRQAEAVLGREPSALLDLVRQSIRIKADVVSRDEREAGPRAMLNFGHTLGHAIEQLSDWTLRHGEAVAVGMVLEAALGTRLGITDPGTADALTAACLAYGLPARPAGSDADDVLEATRADKKARAAEVRYTFLEGVGRVARGEDGAWTHAVNDAHVRAVLADAGTA